MALARRNLFGRLDGGGTCEGLAACEGGGCEEEEEGGSGGGLQSGGAEGGDWLSSSLPAGEEVAEADEAEAADDDDRRCSICLEKFVCGQYARSLPCSHTFHTHCIDAWLTTQSRYCPEDGLPVLPELEDSAGVSPRAAEGVTEGEEEGEEYAAAELAYQFERLAYNRDELEAGGL